MNLKNDLVRLRFKLSSCMDNGDYKNATIIGDHIIDCYKNIEAYEVTMYADDLFNIAYANGEIGDYKRAKELYKESLSNIEDMNLDLERALRLNNIAIIYSKEKNYKENVKINEEVYKIFFTKLGEDNGVSINSLYNLGNSYFDDKCFESALRCLKRALSLRRTKDTDYINNLNAIGYTLEAMQNNESALQYFGRALILIKSSMGEESFEYLKNIYYFGKFNFKTKNYEKALEYLNIFLNLAPNIIGTNNVYYLIALYYVSETYKEKNNNEMTLSLKVQLLDLSKEFMGNDHIFMADNMIIVALLYEEERNYSEAEKYCKEALKIKKEIIGEYNLNYLKDLILLSTIYYESGQYTKTIEIVSEATMIIEQSDNLLNGSISKPGKIYLHADKIDFNLELKPILSNDVETLEELLESIYKNIGSDKWEE